MCGRRSATAGDKLKDKIDIPFALRTTAVTPTPSTLLPPVRRRGRARPDRPSTLVPPVRAADPLLINTEALTAPCSSLQPPPHPPPPPSPPSPPPMRHPLVARLVSGCARCSTGRESRVPPHKQEARERLCCVGLLRSAVDRMTEADSQRRRRRETAQTGRGGVRERAERGRERAAWAQLGGGCSPEGGRSLSAPAPRGGGRGARRAARARAGRAPGARGARGRRRPKAASGRANASPVGSGGEQRLVLVAAVSWAP